MPLGDVKLMGVCNVTPDSFSGDGWMSSGQNQYQQLQRGNELQKELLNVVEQGADVVDVGGESTAPGSTKVDPAEEMERLRVVMESVRSLLAARPGTATFSVDTVNAGTARAAIGCGFTMINDVSGGRNDEGMFPLVAAHPEVKYVMMYCKNASGRADLDDDQTNAQASILSFFDEQVARALREGVQRSQLILDPGMGAFISVRAEDSIEAMRAVPEFKARYKCPVLIGASRKGFLTTLVRKDFGAKSRVGSSLAAALFAAEHGADYLRVHDVLATRQFLDAYKNLRAYTSS